ncbi:MAG TPA: NUDIX domain-containing protein [Polaromonas sp.]|uniref:NUDIX hydrolase n=1 Tax=Polaromonas sp. TaxID=1869339 RepID=UPI002D350517|nr:NUDIX domain-containing protein [Polaromonas sp.]HYW56766.1 NUDIX domain-containing protein [Polaromonas sp.]
MSGGVLNGLDRQWLADLRASSQLAPSRARMPLLAGGVVIGSVEPAVASEIACLPFNHGHSLLSMQECQGASAVSLAGEPTAGLHAVALALREVGLAHAWRNEQLAVTGPQGEQVGTVERAVVRVLGIATRAVHLIGRAPDGRHWVQQRSLTKPNDPGLLDTLMGGMIGAADTLAGALERETWEEAGLRLHQLKDIAHGGHVDIRCPSDDAGGHGYVVERIDWYHCSVPDGLEPANQDGEVERFVLMDTSEMLERMHEGQFTREAALLQADWMTAPSDSSSRT